MLNFSETVCVFRSSSLPALDGARESSKGDANGPLDVSELQLVRRDDMPEGERMGDSSRYGRVLSFRGGRSISADSATPAFLYNDGTDGDRMPWPLLIWGVMVGRTGCVNERDDVVLAVPGRAEGGELSSVRASCVPELRRMCGGPEPRGDCGISDDMLKNRVGVDAVGNRRLAGDVVVFCYGIVGGKRVLLSASAGTQWMGGVQQRERLGVTCSTVTGQPRALQLCEFRAVASFPPYRCL